MGTFPRSRADREPRPVCPECSRVVKAETAVCITEAGSATKRGRKPRLDLVGVYCSSDCALTAWNRGWPWNREIRKGYER